MNAHYGPMFDEVLEHVEPSADVGAALFGRVDQDLVERRSARPVSPRQAIFNEVAHAKRKVAGIEDHAGHRWSALGNLLEHTPVAQAARAMTMDEVPVRDVAGKGGAVHKQHPDALPGEEHRQRRPCTARPDHDDVVHVSSFFGGAQDIGESLPEAASWTVAECSWVGNRRRYD